MAEMINISGLTKSFGPLKAVDDVNLTVRGGEVLGFLGPNGAGKTTTMRMITGFLDPTAGSVSVCGHDVATDAIAAREKIGYLPEGAPLYGDITPQALLEFVAGTRGFSGAQKDERIARAAERLALHEVLFRPIDTLSKGFKRRVGLAQAILHEPDVLILGRTHGRSRPQPEAPSPRPDSHHGARTGDHYLHPHSRRGGGGVHAGGSHFPRADRL